MPHDIIDNRDEKLVEHIKSILGSTDSARFAVGYFFLSGLVAIQDKLAGVQKLRLLIGNTTNRETIEQISEFSRRTADQGYTDEPTLDIYRGRQIWIDHGNGVVTRYAHLGVIAEGIEEGVEVEQGQVIGGVGESGTPEAITAPGTELHLHAEVRIGESFLGDELPPGEVRALYRRLFGLDGN